MLLKQINKIRSQFRKSVSSKNNLIRYVPGADCTKPLSNFSVDVRSGDFSFELPIDVNHKFEINIPSGQEDLVVIIRAGDSQELIALTAIWVKGELYALSQLIHPSKQNFYESIRPITKISGNAIEINDLPMNVSYSPCTKFWKVTTC